MIAAKLGRSVVRGYTSKVVLIERSRPPPANDQSQRTRTAERTEIILEASPRCEVRYCASFGSSPRRVDHMRHLGIRTDPLLFRLVLGLEAAPVLRTDLL
jgi:hypothetical protein